MFEEIYSNERLVGHGVKAKYSTTETYSGGVQHRIRIKESDVYWGDTKEISLTPEELIEITVACIESEEFPDLVENKDALFEGLEHGDLAKKILGE